MGWARAQGTTGISGFAAPQGEGHGFDPAQGGEGMWSPLSLGSSLAAWYKADAGCYTDAACLFTAASNMDLRRASSTALQVGDIDFTFVLFVKHSSLTSWNTLLRKGFGWEAGGEFSIFSDGSGAVTWRVRKADDSTNVDVTSTDVCGTSSFDMIEVYHDATNNVIGVRVNNGAAVTAAVPAGVFTGTNNLSIGDSDSGGTSNRSIARVGFWKRLLTAGERTSLYNAGAGKFYADLTTAEKVSLVDYWNLCESSGTRVGSHAGLNLTPTNGPTVAAGPGEGLCVDNSPRKRREDQSGNARNATQSDITKQSLHKTSIQNSLPAGLFDGVNDWDAADAVASVVTGSDQPFTYACVIKKVASAAYHTMFSFGGSTGSRRHELDTSNTPHYYSERGDNAGASVGVAGAATPDTSTHVLVWVFTGTTISLYVDGVVDINAAAMDVGTITLNQATFGALRHSSVSQFFNGYSMEELVISGALSTGSRTSLEAYLRQRWGTA